MKKHIVIISILAILVSAGCGNKHELKEVYVGLNSTHYLYGLKPDSFSRSPPMPPSKVNILPFNVFESKSGKVFFYELPIKPKVCGYMLTDIDPGFEYYLDELQNIKKSNLIQINSKNIDIIKNRIIQQKLSDRYVSIGIFYKTTKNKLIINLINSLSSSMYIYGWKIREVNNIESHLEE